MWHSSTTHRIHRSCDSIEPNDWRTHIHIHTTDSGKFYLQLNSANNLRICKIMFAKFSSFFFFCINEKFQKRKKELSVNNIIKCLRVKDLVKEILFLYKIFLNQYCFNVEPKFNHILQNPLEINFKIYLSREEFNSLKYFKKVKFPIS